MSRLTPDETAEYVSRNQILRHEPGQRNISFPCSADHEQDWQPCPVDPYSCLAIYICVTIQHTYIPGTYKDKMRHSTIIFKARHRPTLNLSTNSSFSTSSVMLINLVRLMSLPTHVQRYQQQRRKVTLWSVWSNKSTFDWLIEFSYKLMSKSSPWSS